MLNLLGGLSVFCFCLCCASLWVVRRAIRLVLPPLLA